MSIIHTRSKKHKYIRKLQLNTSDDNDITLVDELNAPILNQVPLNPIHSTIDEEAPLENEEAPVENEEEEVEDEEDADEEDEEANEDEDADEE